MGYETYHIPVNYTDAGKLFGLFEIRNVVEAVLIGLPVLALCARFLPVYLNQKRRPPHGICAAASFLAGMICHFYRECFCSSRSVMLCRLMPRVERLCSMALVAGGRMPSAPRRMSAELKLSTKR